MSQPPTDDQLDAAHRLLTTLERIEAAYRASDGHAPPWHCETCGLADGVTDNPLEDAVGHMGATGHRVTVGRSDDICITFTWAGQPKPGTDGH
jgi:hypothetical protein